MVGGIVGVVVAFLKVSNNILQAVTFNPYNF